MPFSVATAHNHSQTTAATVWTIIHNLNVTYPVVECFLFIDGSYIKAIPSEVVSVDATTIEVHWSEARTGKARVI